MGCTECDNPKIMARGLCSKHYKRWYKGKPLDDPDRKKALLPKDHSFYMAWTNMKTRCDNPKSTQYKWYGGRGITYCEEWAEFENFYDDMFLNWEAGKTLDRKDNNDNYYKENCEWSTHKEQALNRRPWGSCK